MPISSESLYQDAAWSEFILANLAHGLFTVDPDLKITYFNPMAERITGYPASEALGRSCGDIMRGGMCGDNCPLRSVLSREQSSVSTETLILTKDNHTVPIVLRTAAVFDDQGNLLGAVESFMDISQVKKLEAERAQTLSFFAHDMKSPLVTVAGFLERLLAGKAGQVNQKQRDYLTIMQKELSRIQSLVMDFLDVAQLSDQEGPQLITAPVDLAKLLGGLGQTYARSARSKGLQFSVEIADSLPKLVADEHRLQRLFANLLDNAVKYSPQGRVRLSAVVDQPAWVKVEIADQGPGFSPDDLENLFTPFHRGSAGKGIEGSGLGMAAVKSIAEAHGGEVLVRNRRQGGALVTVSLPVEGEPAPPA